MYSNGRILPWLFALGWLQVATTSPYQAFPTTAGNDLNKVNGQEATLSQIPNQEDPAPAVWKINSDGAIKTTPVIDLQANKEPSKQQKADVNTVKKDAVVIAPEQQLGVKVDDVAVTTPSSPAVESSATKVKEGDDRDGKKEVETIAVDNDRDDSTQTWLIIGSQDVNSPDTSGDDDEIAQVDTSNKNNCLKARCTPAPAGQNCKETPIENLPTSLNGITNECCPVHICQREDGSSYYHYAIEVENDPPTSQFPQQSSSFSSSISVGPVESNKNEFFAPPPRPFNLPPFLASFLPPIFPLPPPPPTFFNTAPLPGRQSPLSSQNVVSSGLFRPLTSTSSFQIIIPPQGSNDRLQSAPNSEAFSRQSSLSPLLQLFSKQSAPEDGSVSKSTPMGNAPVTTKFNPDMSFSSGPFGANDEAQRDRRNMFAPVFAPRGFLPLPYRPGGF